MKLEFDGKDIQQILIEKASALGIPANKCRFKALYGSLDSAEVWFEEPNPAPAEETELP